MTLGLFHGLNNLNEGDLDGVFLMMKDMLCKIKGNDSHVGQTKIKIDLEDHKSETELLDIAYKCIRHGEPPEICKIILESRAYEIIISQRAQNPRIARILTIVSMVNVLYMHDIDKLYEMAGSLCSPEARQEIWQCSSLAKASPNINDSSWIMSGAIKEYPSTPSFQPTGKNCVINFQKKIKKSVDKEK